MPAIALPWVAPAVGEGLLWGAGALGTGLAALGIIENKDAIRDGISDFGNWVSTGVGNGIRAWSDAMSPKGPVGPSPYYDAATGRPIAVADATRVQMPLLRQQIKPRPFGATRSVRYDSDGEPIFFPWQAGSPERPIQLKPVTVVGSRVMRTDSGGAQPAQPAQPASASGSGSTAPAPANPNPQQDPEQNNSSNSGNSGNQRKPSFRERQKKVLNRIKKGYGNTLVGLEYGLGFGAPIAGLGYGVYKWMQPDKTRADSILDSQLYQVRELNKAVQINENQKKIDAILQQIQSGSPQTQSNDSNYIAPQQVVNPTDTLDF